ncbi:mixed-linked glucanase [Peziza echinospora]|nr:mixed-linked glucanase [Peziza echinospora]
MVFSINLTFLFTVFLLFRSVCGAYSVLAEEYTSGNFFQKFDFYTGSDPTNGHVQYVSQSVATSLGLIRNDAGSVYVGVENQKIAPNGRQSVRLESKKRFTRGLFILDMSHMPSSTCGTWPAFWTLGDNWPNNGEIDIIEGVHKNTQNSMALHTKDGCSISTGSNLLSGVQVSKNCFVNAVGQSNNQGCSQLDSRTNSWGDGFNNVKGGVYAMEWTTQFIKIWYFPRNLLPSDILGKNPEPLKWGTPAGFFQGNCNINQNFNSHKIIFDITFCGDWAGNTWGSAGCGALASTCNAYVANNPTAYKNSYWQINSLRVFSS